MAQMAADGHDQPRHRPGAVRHAEDGRDAPRQRLPQARRALAHARCPPRSSPSSRPRRAARRCSARRARCSSWATAFGVHAEPVADLVVGEPAELAQHPGRALALGHAWRRAPKTAARAASSSARCSGVERGSSGARLDVGACLAQRVERGLAASPAPEVEAGVARGGEQVEAQGVVVAGGADAAAGEVQERVLEGVGRVVLAAEHAQAVAVHAVAVLLEEAGRSCRGREVGRWLPCHCVLGSGDLPAGWSRRRRRVLMRERSSSLPGGVTPGHPGVA